METSTLSEDREALVKQLNEITGRNWTVFAFGAYIEVYTPMLALGKILFTFVDYPGKTAFVAGVAPSDADPDAVAGQGLSTLTYVDVPADHTVADLTIAWHDIIQKLTASLNVLSAEARHIHIDYLRHLALKRGW